MTDLPSSEVTITSYRIQGDRGYAIIHQTNNGNCIRYTVVASDGSLIDECATHLRAESTARFWLAEG